MGGRVGGWAGAGAGGGQAGRHAVVLLTGAWQGGSGVGCNRGALQPLSTLLRASPPSVCGCAGFVQRKWVWVLLFSPLWATLFVSFGLGPILMRTPEPVSVYTVANTAAFLAVAVLVANTPTISRAAGLSVDDADA